MDLTINIDGIFEEDNPLSKYKEVNLEFREDLWFESDEFEIDLNYRVYGGDHQPAAFKFSDELPLSEVLRLQTFLRMNTDIVEYAVRQEMGLSL